MALSIRFLGTGTSVGVPQIGCDCPVCLSDDPRDRRRRTGLYVTTERTAFLIDTPPELREACLACGVKRADAVVLTHAHMDHIAGFDDVRRFNTLNGGNPMPCYASPETVEAMHHVFPYISDKANTLGLYRPMINFLSVTEPFQIGDVRLTPFDVPHGPRTFGYLMEQVDAATGGVVVRAGYASDCSALPEEALARLAGVDVMILNCLRHRPHPTHLTFERSVEYLERIRPRLARFVHMCHDVSHAQYLRELAALGHADYAPAYDGEIVTVEREGKETQA